MTNCKICHQPKQGDNCWNCDRKNFDKAITGQKHDGVIRSKGDIVKIALAMIFGGGFLCLFIITAIIGIPLIILGIIMLASAPFHNANWIERLKAEGERRKAERNALK